MDEPVEEQEVDELERLSKERDEYLDALHVALKTAKAALPSANKKFAAVPSGIRARA